MNSEKKSYPSWENTKPVRIGIGLLDFLRSHRRSPHESVSEVLERLLKIRINRWKREKRHEEENV